MGKQSKPEPTDSTVYWFVILEQARGAGNFDRAAEAKRQLERLGLRIKFVKRKEVPSAQH